VVRIFYQNELLVQSERSSREQLHPGGGNSDDSTSSRCR